jgi:F-type H+-transporting ATPase subunit delta
MSNHAQIHPYAKALFELIHSDEKALDQSVQILNELSEIAKREPQLMNILQEPFASAALKIDLIYKLVPALPEQEILRKLTCLLAEKKRIHYLPDLAFELKSLIDQLHNITQIEMTTADEFSKEELNSIKKSLESSLKQSIDLKVKVDKDLIAGLVIETEEYIIDNSLRGRLNKMRQVLKS